MSFPMVPQSFTLSGMARKALPESEKKGYAAARVSNQLLAALSEMARADQRTLSFMIEKALREFVERHGATAEPPSKQKKR